MKAMLSRVIIVKTAALIRARLADENGPPMSDTTRAYCRGMVAALDAVLGEPPCLIGAVSDTVSDTVAVSDTSRAQPSR